MQEAVNINWARKIYVPEKIRFQTSLREFIFIVLVNYLNNLAEHQPKVLEKVYQQVLTLTHNFFRKRCTSTERLRPESYLHRHYKPLKNMPERYLHEREDFEVAYST